MAGTKTTLQPGDIFAIPLFLPSFQEWRRLDELIDYRKYDFPAGDPYVFGRLIGHQPGNMDLIEVFSYFGPVPEGPEVILQSGQMFAPVMLAGAFARGRWRPVFRAARYDKWAESGYAGITFLMGAGDSLPNSNDYALWRGGENLRHVPREEWLALKAAGAFLDTRFPKHKGGFAFDCEADTFCITARRKKPLREFALAFHELALDADAFEALLARLC